MSDQYYFTQYDIYLVLFGFRSTPSQQSLFNLRSVISYSWFGKFESKFRCRRFYRTE